MECHCTGKEPECAEHMYYLVKNTHSCRVKGVLRLFETKVWLSVLQSLSIVLYMWRGKITTLGKLAQICPFTYLTSSPIHLTVCVLTYCVCLLYNMTVLHSPLSVHLPTQDEYVTEKIEMKADLSAP